MSGLRLYKHACILLTAATILSGCSKYQYVYLSGALPQNNLKEYVVDNDTISLRYNFTRQGIATTVSVENKLQQPLYIDYQRSVIVVNNEQLTGPAFLDDQPSYIAPLSKVLIHNVPLRWSYIKVQDTLRSEQVLIGSGRGKKYTYSGTDSPLHFRHILAITPNEDYSYPTFHDYSFWIETLVESHSGPKTTASKASNQSYIHKESSVGSAFLWTIVLTITVWGAVALGFAGA